jgi:hypothetical protein
MARNTAAEGGASPSLREQISRSKQRAYEQLKDNAYRRKGDKQKRSRVKDKKGRTKKDKDDLCKAAAECLAKQCADHYKKRKIGENTPTKPGMGKKGQRVRRSSKNGGQSL